MNKIIRCHVLDRADQLREADYWQNTEKLKTVEFEAVVELANKALEGHLKRIEERQKHIDYLVSTMHIDWIDNPPY